MHWDIRQKLKLSNNNLKKQTLSHKSQITHLKAK